MCNTLSMCTTLNPSYYNIHNALNPSTYMNLSANPALIITPNSTYPEVCPFLRGAFSSFLHCRIHMKYSRFICPSVRHGLPDPSAENS